MLKDQARRRAVSEHAAILVGQPSLGRTDTAPAGNDLAFSLHQAGLRGDRPKKGNLELERCLCKALVEHGADSEPHAAIEQSRGKASVHGAVDEPLNIFEPAHRSLPVVIDDAKTLSNEGFRH